MKLILPSMSPEEKTDFYKKCEFLEDWMLQDFYFNDLQKKIKFRITMDACCNRRGTNAHAKQFCSAWKSAFDQDLDDENVYFNPPYMMCDDFVVHFEHIKKRVKKFKAMSVLPERKSNEWFKKLAKRNRWRIIWRYPVGTQLFSKPCEKDLYDREKRCKPLMVKEPILVLVLNDDEYPDHATYNFSEHLADMLAAEAKKAGYIIPYKKRKPPTKARSVNRNKRADCPLCKKNIRANTLS